MTVTDFLQDKTNHPAFEGSEAISNFIKNTIDMMNSRHPFVKRHKAPVTWDSLSTWIAKCQELASYLFHLKDVNGNLLQHEHQKTVI